MKFRFRSAVQDRLEARQKVSGAPGSRCCVIVSEERRGAEFV